MPGGRPAKDPSFLAPGVEDCLEDVKSVAFTLGLGKQRIYQLARDGIIVRQATGAYWFKRSIRNYVRTLRARNGADEPDPADEAPRQTSGYEAAKARKMLADAERAELELETLAGELVRTDHVAALWEDMLGRIRGKILSLPAKMAPLVQDESRIPVLEEILRDAAAEALTEMSLLELPEEAIPDSPDQDAPAAAKKNGRRVGRGRKAAQ